VWLASFVVLTTGWGAVAAVRDYPQEFVDGITAPYAYGPAFGPDGRLLYVHRDMDNRTQLRRLRTDGGGAEVLPGGPDLRFLDTAPAWAADGSRIAYVADGPAPNGYAAPPRGLYVAAAAGSDPRKVADLDFYDQDVDPAFSPDGTRVAFSTGHDIWIVGVDGTGLTRLTRAREDDHSPAFSPDGRRIAFVAERDHDSEVYVMNADGTGQRRLTDNEGQDTDPVFSPDGTRIAYVHARYGTQFADIVVMNPDGTGKRRLTPVDPSADRAPAFSPDGRRIAFVSDRSGHRELWLMRADGTGPRRLTFDSGPEVTP
jgi:Tol biopolymer transport system component